MGGREESVRKPVDECRVVAGGRGKDGLLKVSNREVAMDRILTIGFLLI